MNYRVNSNVSYKLVVVNVIKVKTTNSMIYLQQ